MIDVSIFSIGGFSGVAIIAGVAGYVWGYRRTIKKVIPGKVDDKIFNVVGNVAEELNIPIDKLAKEARKDLKDEARDKLHGSTK